MPRTGGGPAEPAPKPKEKLQRPAGISREAFALLDGAHPVVPAALAREIDKGGLKEKRKTGAPKGQARCPAQTPNGKAVGTTCSLGAGLAVRGKSAERRTKRAACPAARCACLVCSTAVLLGHAWKAGAGAVGAK